MVTSNLKGTSTPYSAILLCDQIILNRDVTTKNNWSFQTILTGTQNCLLGGMLVALTIFPYLR